ncbi:general substrate transporter [Microdochium bolleyi]|uniref:General substrate transporter n=1 Tax=Microdochium bolleyi TaxID=196109 RepID=A0A136IKJ4_9PEZI|nr:general substrate transporter [Microdochium bolleyi]
MTKSQPSLAIDGQLANEGWASWLGNRGILKLNAILILSLISSYATGYDGSMMNGLQSLDSWKAAFNDPDAQQLAILNAIQNIGQLAALPFCAMFCDKFGRRPALVVGATIMLLGAGLQGGAQNTGMFIAARGILGFGLALNITAAPLLIMESAYPSQQAPMVSIYNTLWGLGALSAAWITYGTFRLDNDWAWRIPSILQALSSILQITLCWLIDESPRWLISQEREAEAEALLVKYHANGDAGSALVRVEMEEIRTAIRLENEAMQSTSYMSFFQTPGNRRRFFIILAVGFFSQWSGNGLISYYLTLILNSIGYRSQETQTLINALLTVWGLFWGVVFSLLVNRISRRALFLFSTLGSLAVYVCWTALEATYEMSTDLNEDGTGGPEGVAKGVLAMIFLFNFFFTAGWGTLQVTYVVEILPFNLRARGLVLYNLFVACALIFNQYANPIGVTNSGWKYYITYCVWLAVEAVVVYFLFVETSGLSLEETAMKLDGKEAEDKLVSEVLRNTEKTDKSVEMVNTERVGSRDH